MTRTNVGAAFLVAAGAAAISGCSHSDRPETAPVRGKITYRGAPVAGATITFLCPGAPRLAIGTSDSQGNYRLTTFTPNDGAVIGTHTVTVRKVASEPASDVAPPPVDSQSMSKAIEQAMRQTARQIVAAEKAPASLPAKYADRTTSGLRQEVVAGENVINLELTD